MNFYKLLESDPFIIVLEIPPLRVLEFYRLLVYKEQRITGESIQRTYIVVCILCANTTNPSPLIEILYTRVLNKTFLKIIHRKFYQDRPVISRI